jgi:predicted DNA-binding protein with PD1-like motif
MKRYLKQLLLLALVGSALIVTMLNTKAQQRGTSSDLGYVSPATPVATGKAPGMKVRLLSESGGVKNYAIILARGDEVMSGLTDFAAQYHIQAARFTAIGAFSNATVAWFDESKKEFKTIPIDQQMELVSMIGDVALSNNKPAVHTHVAFAASDGAVRGGHLIEAHVSPTLELFLTAYPTALEKKLDEPTGLMLIDLSQTQKQQ